MQLWSAHISIFFPSERWDEVTDPLLPWASAEAESILCNLADRAALASSPMQLWQQNSTPSLWVTPLEKPLCLCQQNNSPHWHVVCIPKGALSLRRPGQNSRGASRSKISRQPSLCGCLRGEQSLISRLIGLTVELLDTAKPECVLLARCSIPFAEFCVWELRARPKLCAPLQQTCTAPPPSRAGFSGPGLGRVRLCIFPGSNSAKNRNLCTLLH